MTNEIMDGNFYKHIKEILATARSKAYSAVNFVMVEAYWEIGKSIVERQGGNPTAEYGTKLIEELSRQMTSDFGKGFTVNLIIIPFYCRIILQPGSVGQKFRPECIQFMINHQNLLLLRDDVIFPVTARPDFCHEGTIFVKEAECIAPRLSKTDYHGCKWSSYRTLASLDTDKIHRLTIYILL